MGFSQGVTDDLPDSGRVRVRHLRRALEHAVRLEDGLGWQREHLKEVAIKRDEIFVDQGIARH
jgi:hypothetical protein